MSKGVLLIDIGNTATTCAVAIFSRILKPKGVPTHAATRRGVTSMLRDLCSSMTIEGACISSVVPSVTSLWREVVGSMFGVTAVMVSHKVKLGIEIDYPKPSAIGGDRLANASAAAHIYGAPVMVADFGTALTFDVVSKQGAYVGGVIAPGLPFATDYLSEKTELLPRVALKGHCPSMGRSTMDAMKIGAHVGYRGMVREIVRYLRKSPGLDHSRLCATGGYAKWALHGIDMPIKVEPKLTLMGLLIIYRLNTE